MYAVCIKNKKMLSARVFKVAEDISAALACNKQSYHALVWTLESILGMNGPLVFLVVAGVL